MNRFNQLIEEKPYVSQYVPFKNEEKLNSLNEETIFELKKYLDTPQKIFI